MINWSESCKNLWRGAEMGGYLVPLVDVVGAGKQDGAPDHLSEYAAHGPYVDHVRVPHSQYDFWRSETSDS